MAGNTRSVGQHTCTKAPFSLSGTGTLALDVQRRLGSAGRVVGIDPGTQQIANARAKAARRLVPIAFQIGVIE